MRRLTVFSGRCRLIGYAGRIFGQVGVSQRESKTEAQLRDWIVTRVRRDFRLKTFAEPFEIVRRRDSGAFEPSWAIGALAIEDWTPHSFIAFERATGEAQQRFDLV